MRSQATLLLREVPPFDFSFWFVPAVEVTDTFMQAFIRFIFS